jgi:hypothetical protein
MNLALQLTSLELSKKLKELGVKQKSLFYWEWASDDCYGIAYGPYTVWPRDSGEWKHFSAFTMAEVLALLPIHITSFEQEPLNSYRLYITNSFVVEDVNLLSCTPITIVNYKIDTFDMNNLEFRSLTNNMWDKNSANSLAKMFIYLIENKLYEVVSEN